MDEPPGHSSEDLEELLDEAANNLEEDNDDMAPPDAANMTPVRPPKVNNNPKRALKVEECLEYLSHPRISIKLSELRNKCLKFDFSLNMY